MTQPDQKEMFEQLDKQRQQQLRVDRILKVVFPITAFLLCVICANYNWQSTVGTFLILVIAFYAVGIKRMNLYMALAMIAVYCFIDIFLSYGSIPPSALGRQMGTMLTFVGIIGISRPHIDRWYANSIDKL